MAKAFSESEMESIKEKLIESCRVCWEKYGYRKTNVAEICAMSNISTGAFYAFFPSKEMLFVTTANEFNGKLLSIFKESRPTDPTKYDLAAGFKLIVEELKNNKWIFSVRGDYEIFLRKLPKGFIEQDREKDMIDIKNFIKIYNVKPKASIEEITAVIYTIVMSLYFSDTIGKHHSFALDLLIDSAMEKLFE